MTREPRMRDDKRKAERGATGSGRPGVRARHIPQKLFDNLPYSMSHLLSPGIYGALYKASTGAGKTTGWCCLLSLSRCTPCLLVPIFQISEMLCLSLPGPSSLVVFF